MQINSITGYCAPKANFNITSKPVSFGISGPGGGFHNSKTDMTDSFERKHFKKEKSKDIEHKAPVSEDSFETASAEAFDSAPKSPVKAPSTDYDYRRIKNDCNTTIMHGGAFNTLFK